MFLLTRERDIFRAAFLACIAAALVLTMPAPAQNFSVIHIFMGADGANPVAGLAIDAQGRLYGTTQSGGHQSSFCAQSGCGTAFRLANQVEAG